MMAITRLGSYSVSWAVKHTVTALAATSVSGDAFRLLMSLGQQARDNETRQTGEDDLTLSLTQTDETAAAEETLVPNSLFTYWANLKVTDERFYTGGGIYSAFSRFMTMMQDYRDWKREQPESGLPVSLGSEEENLAWLREHFFGALDAFGVLDAVESMYSMGMLDGYERNCIYGTHCIVVETIELVSTIREVPLGYDPYRDDGFELAPLMEFRTLEDILEWLGKFRTQPIADWELKRRELLERIASEETETVSI